MKRGISKRRERSMERGRDSKDWIKSAKYREARGKVRVKGLV